MQIPDEREPQRKINQRRFIRELTNAARNESSPKDVLFPIIYKDGHEEKFHHKNIIQNMSTIDKYKMQEEQCNESTFQV